MARIATVHPTDLNAKGGAEKVAMHILASLQDEHEVTLITQSKPDIEYLNEYFGTDVGNIGIRTIDGWKSNIADIFIRSTELSIQGIKKALVRRYSKKVESEFDLMISLKNEIYFSSNSINYIHFPVRGFQKANTWRRADNISYDIFPSYNPELVHKAFFLLTEIISGRPNSFSGSTKILTNSNWTSSIIEKFHQKDPNVVYPPINVSEFPDQLWKKRETGFVSIGNVTPQKNIHKMIKIIDGVRKINKDVHLHIIGSLNDQSYVEKIKRMAGSRQYIHIEGECTRSELVSIVSKHKYGIHGHPYERFGIAIAELMSAGLIPFVPYGGGQREIVGDNNQLCYRSTDDAIMKINAVIEDNNLQNKIRSELPDARDSFGIGRFHREIRRNVEDYL